MQKRLSKRLWIKAGDGTKPMNTWLPCVYRVEGLANDRFVLVCEEGDGSWAVIEAKAGRRTQVGGHYDNADAALEALENSLDA